MGSPARHPIERSLARREAAVTHARVRFRLRLPPPQPFSVCTTAGAGAGGPKGGVAARLAPARESAISPIRLHARQAGHRRRGWRLRGAACPPPPRGALPPPCWWTPQGPPPPSATTLVDPFSPFLPPRVAQLGNAQRDPPPPPTPPQRHANRAAGVDRQCRWCIAWPAVSGREQHPALGGTPDGLRLARGGTPRAPAPWP